MNERRMIEVQQDLDVVYARSVVRSVARRVGLGTTDQARISLAASSAARALGMGDACRGSVEIEGSNGLGRPQVRVVCSVRDATRADPQMGALSEARQMTDELRIERLPFGRLQVTLIKWAAQQTEYATGRVR